MRDHAGRDVERDGFRSGWQGSQAVIGAPGIIDPEICLIGFAGGGGLGGSYEVIGLLDEVLEAGRRVRKGDEFVLHEETPGRNGVRTAERQGCGGAAGRRS